MASFDEESALPKPLSKLESTELCGGFVTKFKEFQQKVKDRSATSHVLVCLERKTKRCEPLVACISNDRSIIFFKVNLFFCAFKMIDLISG